jgi:hypothetical protein
MTRRGRKHWHARRPRCGRRNRNEHALRRTTATGSADEHQAYSCHGQKMSGVHPVARGVARALLARHCHHLGRMVQISHAHIVYLARSVQRWSTGKRRKWHFHAVPDMAVLRYCIGRPGQIKSPEKSERLCRVPTGT